jgi:hypothetical protein
MTTANQIIGQALGLLGVRSSADAVPGSDAVIALERLNTLLDGWRAQSLFAYATQTITGTLPASTATRTIGPAGQLVASPRPTRIESMFYTSGSTDYEVKPFTAEEYDRIPDKTITGLGPDFYYFNPGLAAGTLSFYPLASENVTLTIRLWLQVTAFADLTTDYTLSPGYLRALVYSLAEECGPDFEREAPPSVLRTAANARTLLKRVNHRVPQLEVTGTERPDILRGY